MIRTLIILSLLTVCWVQGYPQNDGDDIVIGKYRKLHSSVTNEDRTLLVWLPRSYDQSNLSYPVVYILYGQNTSAYLLPTITACDMLAASGAVPEMIIVGVATAERYRDYSSVSDGYINKTVSFFRDELFPFIESNYRTLNYRIVIGPQAGAVFSFYSLINHQDLFNAFILENPFVHQNREILFNMADKYFNKDLTLNRFLFIKEEKNNNPLFIETAMKFAEMMKTNTPVDFRFYFDLEEPSGYFVPPVPSKEGFLRLFEHFTFPDSLKVGNVNEIIDYYRKETKEYGVNFPVPEHVLTMQCDKLLSSRRYKDVSDLLEYMLSLYPHSLNALMRMGDLQRTLGDYEAAIKYYDEFLKLRSVDVISIRNRRDYLQKYISESLVYILENEIKSEGTVQAIRNFKKSKSVRDNKLTYSENDFNSLGYSFLNKGQNAESVKVFKLALEIYPESANLNDSLGEVYMTNNQDDLAIKHYEISLKLNPANENAKKMLERLKTKK